jgi:hypothetical protein
MLTAEAMLTAESTLAATPLRAKAGFRYLSLGRLKLLSPVGSSSHCSGAAADDGAWPRQHLQHLRAQRRQHDQLESSNDPTSARTRRDSSRSARDPAAPAHNQTESNQHRVGCSMVVKMEVLDSAPSHTSRSRSTY